ncbi:response regulator transcription factor [Streptomyces rubiginosohelvolus]|uniref:response regulator transcription factor n=1 Tax=Streptomyces rubiginosohelvolus TaxID=67362 RepID=UPI0033B68B24
MRDEEAVVAELGFPVRRPARHASLHVVPGPPETAAAPGTPVRVYVLASDASARAGIGSLLAGHPAVRLVGDGGPGALDRLPPLHPDVALAHGDRAARQARRLPPHPANAPRPPLVVVAGGTPDGPGTPTRAGGRLPDTATPDQLASALVLAATGYRVQPADRRHGDATAAPSVGKPCRRRKRPAASTVGPEALTGRERQLPACGLSNTEIADRLALSEHTVKTHVQNLLGKQRLHNRVHAAIHAFETGLRTLA